MTNARPNDSSPDAVPEVSVYPKPHRLLPSTLLLALALFGVAPRASLGAPSIQIKADASASAGDNVTDSQTPPTADTGVLPLGLLPASLVLGQSAQARAVFARSTAASGGGVVIPGPGSFNGAILSASTQMSALTPGGTTNPQTAAGASRLEVIYDDVLTATGLPAGTPVTLRVKLELAGLIGHLGPNCVSTAQLTFGDPLPAAPLVVLVDSDQDGTFTATEYTQLVVLSGVPHPIEFRLLAQAVGVENTPGDGLGGLVFGSVDGDYRNNPRGGRLHIDAITPGASYVLASGASLGSPVAEVAPPRMTGGAIALSAPSPNPARGVVRLHLTVPAEQAVGRWEVLDAAGRCVWRSGEQRWARGVAELLWPGTDESGAAVAPGLYLVHVVTDRGAVTRRIVSVR